MRLANSYQIIAKFGEQDFGWTHCVYNHITCKVDERVCAELGHEGPLFLINAFGCRFDEVTPESLHTIDLNGAIVRRGLGVEGVKDRGVLVAGFTIHSAIHAARPDVNAIFHTHHPDVVAVSALKCGLLPCSNEGALSLSTLSKNRHDYEGTATDPTEKERIASALGPTAKALIMNNHGVVACGTSLPEALRILWVYTKACTYQVRAMAAAGGDIDRMVFPSEEAIERCLAREMEQQKEPLGDVEFEAWMRPGNCM